jgi:hypothetical protein
VSLGLLVLMLIMAAFVLMSFLGRRGRSRGRRAGRWDDSSWRSGYTYDTMSSYSSDDSGSDDSGSDDSGSDDSGSDWSSDSGSDSGGSDSGSD